MFVRTVIWRSFSRRAMMLGPLTVCIRARCPRSTQASPGVGTKICPIAARSTRAPRQVSDGDLKPPLALEHRTDGTTADSQLDGLLYVAHIDAVSRE